MSFWSAIKTAAHSAWSRVESALKWAPSVLSEPNGTGSASRVCFFFVTVTVCGVLAGHLYLKHSLPDAGTLGGLAGLLTAGATGYGANKITTKGASGDDRH
jgi:hypothetical protein